MTDLPDPSRASGRNDLADVIEQRRKEELENIQTDEQLLEFCAKSLVEDSDSTVVRRILLIADQFARLSPRQSDKSHNQMTQQGLPGLFKSARTHMKLIEAKQLAEELLNEDQSTPG